MAVASTALRVRADQFTLLLAVVLNLWDETYATGVQREWRRKVPEEQRWS